MEKVQSIRGKQKILFNGYAFVKQKDLANDVISYECEKRRGNGKGNSQCKAKIKVRDEIVVGSLNTHTHEPDAARCEVLTTTQNIKKRAVETEEPPQQILGRELQGMSEAASVQMVPLRHIRRQIRRARQEVRLPIPLPTDRSSLVLPDQYKTLSSGEEFLLFDSGVGDINRIFIFGTERSASLLGQSPNWFVDGTFSIVPAIFFQLYSIHAIINGDVICCLYCLLPNKTTETYNRVFSQVKALIPTAQPVTAMMDYEKAAMNSFCESFPEAEIHGCFYHLSQSIHRKMQGLGFQTRYQEDTEFATYVRMISAIAFVPLQDTVSAFEALQDSTTDADLQQLFDYFEDNYIGTRRRRGRAAPLFAHAVWSVHSRVERHLPRTNNNVEGWHRKMQAAVSAHHPNIWRFMTILHREHSLVNVVVAQRLGGHDAEPKKKKYRDCSARIENIVSDFPNRPILHYLRALAHNV